MEKNEITYERKISGSYMKIRTDHAGGFDERMLMRKQIPGLLSVEKCYVDGCGQYWYDISGKQSLDTFCRVKEAGQVFFEQLVHSVCEELAVIDQHLMDTNCLCLTPELVYISIQTGELMFTAVPGNDDDVAVQFRELMEYLLTKVDHKDPMAVRLAYDIYEKTLEEGYSIADIQESIVQSHMAEGNEEGRQQEKVEQKGKPDKKEQPELVADFPYYQRDAVEGRYCFAQEAPQSGREKTAFLQHWREMLHRKIEGLLFWKKIQMKGRGGKQEANAGCQESGEWRMIYPDDELKEENRTGTHPTVCLTDYRNRPEGILRYEGRERFPDIVLEQRELKIGHSEEMDVVIAKDTISRYHARIEHENSGYYLEDFNSTNGTFVNGEPLTYKERRKLEANDVICFADVKYRFV